MYVGPLEWDRGIRGVDRLRHVLAGRRGREYLPEREPRLAQSFARQAAERVRALEPDVVLSTGSIPVAYLDCPQPLVLWSDATFAALHEFHPAADARSVRNGHQLEQRALDRAACAVFSSDWAARSAIERYGTAPEKVHVVPFGANLPSAPAREELRPLLAGRSEGGCRLLLIGVDWEKKGAERAVALVETLRGEGVAATLTVVGCNAPPGRELPDYVDVAGYVSKADPQGVQRIDTLLREAHFLVHPTESDCTPVVLSEAASRALPAIATSLGGIRSVIRDGVTGRSVPLESFVAEAAEFVLGALPGSSRYEALALAAYDEYERRLNWTTGGRRVRDLILEAAARN